MLINIYTAFIYLLLLIFSTLFFFHLIWNFCLFLLDNGLRFSFTSGAPWSLQILGAIIPSHLISLREEWTRSDYPGSNGAEKCSLNTSTWKKTNFSSGHFRYIYMEYQKKTLENGLKCRLLTGWRASNVTTAAALQTNCTSAHFKCSVMF